MDSGQRGLDTAGLPTALGNAQGTQGYFWDAGSDLCTTTVAAKGCTEPGHRAAAAREAPLVPTQQLELPLPALVPGSRRGVWFGGTTCAKVPSTLRALSEHSLDRKRI